MFPRALAFIGLACVTPTLFAAGCGDAATVSPSPAPPTQIQTFAPDAADAGSTEEPATVHAPAATDAGASLCRGSSPSNDCDPDDLVNACDLGLIGVDGGIFASDGDVGGIACHVIQSGGAVQTTCMPAGLGLNNATCLLPTDCAVGHECVGSGVCHQYCCGGNSTCSLNEFCDIQPTTHNPNLVVPVCMPEFPCTLLDNDSCPANQQCAVVRDDGTTSCVAVGTQRNGDSCETAHCERGLLCLGPEGSRRCTTLCYTADATACQAAHGAARTCMGALPLFLSPSVGVCQ